MPQVYGWACIFPCQNIERLLEARRHSPLKKKAVQALQAASTFLCLQPLQGRAAAQWTWGWPCSLAGQGRGQRGTGGASGSLSPEMPPKEFYTPPV